MVGQDTKVSTSLGRYGAPGHSKRTSKSETISWNEYPTNSITDSQWGPGFQIYSGSELDLICVNCGTQGSMTLTGTVNWTVSDGTIVSGQGTTTITVTAPSANSASFTATASLGNIVSMSDNNFTQEPCRLRALYSVLETALEGSESEHQVTEPCSNIALTSRVSADITRRSRRLLG